MRQETSFLLSEISKPKRHSINYSPSLHQSDILIMTGGGYRVSVRLQSRHDRGSNSNMFAAKKYGPLWCVSRLQDSRVNGNNSSGGEHSLFFMSPSPGMKETSKLLVSLHCEWHWWSFCFLTKHRQLWTDYWVKPGTVLRYPYTYVTDKQMKIQTDTLTHERRVLALSGLITGEQVCQSMPK